MRGMPWDRNTSERSELRACYFVSVPQMHSVVVNIPVVTVELDWDTDCWRLMATSYLKTEPAGPRLFRGGDFPAISFTHASEAEAKTDAAILQQYLDLAWSGKAPKAKGREEAEQVTATKHDFANAVWSL